MGFMQTEPKTLTTERIRKERALASMQEELQLQLAQLEGKLLWADQVAESWSNAVVRRQAVLTIP